MIMLQVLKKNSKWYWKMIAENGKVLAHSEQYSSKRKALQTADKVSKTILFVKVRE